MGHGRPGNAIGRKSVYFNTSLSEIDGNTFSFNGHEFKFVEIEGDKGLIWRRPKAESFEYGYLQSEDIEVWFSGQFPQASIRILTKDELASLSKEDLKIMRNEIFARYGYTFRSGGAMETYFKTQKWYEARVKNADDFLTDIEKQNIQLIRSFEQK